MSSVSANDLNDTGRDASNYGSFSDLQDLIDESSGVVELDCDYIQDGSSEIVVDKPITINGNNHVLDGKGASQIIKSASNIVLNDIVFKNGLSNEGGALNLYGGIVNNCTFINNTVFDGKGGAIYLQNGLVNNSRFINNHITTSGSWSTDSYATDECHGGAIFAAESTVENSQFENNSANVAGAVSIQGILNNCTFILNSAHGCGGAVYQIDHSFVLGSSFVNNTAQNHGAAVYETRDCDVENSTFTGNAAGKDCDDICIEHIHSEDGVIGESAFWQLESDKISHFDDDKKVDNACGNPIALLLLSLFVLVIRKKF